MPRRHRYATRQELTELLAGDVPNVDSASIAAVLEALAARNVPVDALVKIEVDEKM
jgi:hypothetical protein